jgi:hypothetical protein
MTQTHPLTPPPELVAQWRKEPEYTDGNKLVTMVTMTTDRLMQLCEKSAQHGADQELQACCEWLDQSTVGMADLLREYRRPKPPSLKEQALAELEEIMTELHDETGSAFTASAIRRALEALDD